MDWHGWVTLRGSEAASIAALFVLLGGAWRWVQRMRAATRDAFARSIGEQVAVSMEPIAAQLETKIGTLRKEWTDRTKVDDERWRKTQELYQRFHEHMDREDRDSAERSSK